VLNTSRGPALAPPTRTSAILVVDACRASREHLVGRLQDSVAGDVLEAADPQEARARTLHVVGALAVVGLDRQDGTAVALIAELRRRGWRRVLAIGTADDPQRLRVALSAGAHGFLVHERSPATAGATVGRAGPRLVLTPRQIEIVRLLADGNSNPQIARALGVSTYTIKSHLMRLAQRLGTGDRTQMVLCALRANVIA
jgi:DNA-binding NarL/FixJ family response regulator